MNFVKRFELIIVPQMERTAKMRETIPQWMESLQDGEQLLIGLPEVLGAWDRAIPLVVFRHMVPDFVAWIDESEEYITRPIYNLPKLTAGFMLVVIDENFDPVFYEPPENASQELLGTLQALVSLLRSQLTSAAA